MYWLPLTDENAKKIASMRNVVGVAKSISDEVNVNIFPHEQSLYPWNEDNFGPLWVPKKGATVQLTAATIPFYRDIIGKYEANTLEERDGQIFINGAQADSYTFKMDYYFMMGDNRHNSADSRYWGFVPEDHIVGKPRFVLISMDRDSEKKFPGNIRWNRLFTWVRGAETK
jgi:signal peptidase I